MNENPETTMNVPDSEAVHRSSFRVHRSRAQRAQAGFTLIELIVVVTIVGILAGLAVVNVKFAQRKAREAALKDNLFEMRKAIDNFYADKQRYPADLNELVPNYIRKIPKDPILMSDDWELVMDDPMSLDSSSFDTEPIPASTDPNEQLQPGVVDVKSKAPGVTLDNVPYTDL